MTAALAKKVEIEMDKPAAKLPEIDPNIVTRQSSGFAFNEWFVRLPEGYVPADILRLDIWKRVQNSKPFKMHDKVRCVAFDLSWESESIVARANSSEVSLTPIWQKEIMGRSKPLFEDENYRVVWVGMGFRAQRKRDGQFMTETTATENLCIRDLTNLYPKRVS